MIGIDEQTAVVSKSNGNYQVLGMGKAVIIDPKRQVFEFHHGQQFSLNHPQLKPISSSVW
jgi:cyanophycinase-like exopeptidase